MTTQKSSDLYLVVVRNPQSPDWTLMSFWWWECQANLPGSQTRSTLLIQILDQRHWVHNRQNGHNERILLTFIIITNSQAHKIYILIVIENRQNITLEELVIWNVASSLFGRNYKQDTHTISKYFTCFSSLTAIKKHQRKTAIVFHDSSPSFVYPTISI